MTVQRKRIVAGALFAALLIAAFAAATWNREPVAAEKPQVTLASNKQPDPTPPDVTDDPAPPVSAAPTESATTTPSTSSASTSDADSDDDDPSPSPSKPKPKPPAESPAEKDWREYVAATRKVVTGNTGSLSVAVGAAADAFVDGDAATLAGLYAVDENAGSTDAQAAIAAYPLLLSTQRTSTVNIFTVNQATVYFTYIVAKWEDAGITSEHTIAIPMRFVDGQWRVSTIDERTPGLVFVQSVQL